jgi:hypothetical protein
VAPKFDEPIPLSALRDLLGIVRGLYAAWKASGVGPIELDALLSVGKELAEVLELASNTRPNTLGHRAAWSRAEAATRQLGELVGAHESLRATVTAASQRVVGSPELTRVSDAGEARRQHERKRN